MFCISPHTHTHKLCLPSTKGHQLSSAQLSSSTCSIIGWRRAMHLGPEQPNLQVDPQRHLRIYRSIHNEISHKNTATGAIQRKNPHWPIPRQVGPDSITLSPRSSATTKPCCRCSSSSCNHRFHEQHNGASGFVSSFGSLSSQGGVSLLILFLPFFPKQIICEL